MASQRGTPVIEPVIAPVTDEPATRLRFFAEQCAPGARVLNVDSGSFLVIVVVFIGGFADALNRNVVRLFCGYDAAWERTRKLYFAYDDDPRAIRDSILRSAGAERAPVVLVGHSYGGDAAHRLADSLAAGVDVRLLVTLDPVSGPWQGRAAPRPAGVERWINVRVGSAPGLSSCGLAGVVGGVARRPPGQHQRALRGRPVRAGPGTDGRQGPFHPRVRGPREPPPLRAARPPEESAGGAVVKTSQVATVVADAGSVDAAITSRFSCRAFHREREVPRAVIEEAILADTGLTDRHKQALLDVYTSFRATNVHPREEGA